MAVFWRRRGHGSARRAGKDRSRLRARLETLVSVAPDADRYAELERQKDELERQKDELERQKDELSVITSSLGEGVCAVSERGEITFMNPSGADMLGWDSLSGESGALAVHAAHAAHAAPAAHAAHAAHAAPAFLMEPAKRAMALRRSVTIHDTRFTRVDGSHFPTTLTASPVTGGGVPSGAVIVFRDISERKAFEEQLARHAFQDPLTGLANRRLLLDHLDHALSQAERTGNHVAVLFCDIDRFKAVNDELGHQVGDELLRVIAERLRGAIRAGDTASRFGGDEFVILLEGVTSAEDADRVAEEVLAVLQDPITLSTGREVVATLSVGVAVSERGQSRQDLLHDADQAMYRAKEQGRGALASRSGTDSAVVAARSLNRPNRDTAFQHVVDRGEMEIHYQPLVSLSDRRIVGAEALVRWNDPDHGILLPGQFIRLAERNGSIVGLEQMVLEQACRQAKTWQREFGATLGICVNLSALHVQQRNVTDHVAGVLESTGLAPSQLCLELSETVALHDVVVTSSVLRELHALGVRLAIDDFGTGHSSFGYLARLPFDVVKIDQSFVHGVHDDPVKSAIVSAVIALARTMGACTVGEGVESQTQLEELTGLGCDVAQGFYFARPLPTAAFGKMLTASAEVDLRLLGSTKTA